MLKKCPLFFFCLVLSYLAEHCKINQTDCSIIAHELKELKRDDLARDVLVYMFSNLSLNESPGPKEVVIKPLCSKHLVRLNDLDVELDFKPFKFQVSLFQTLKIENQISNLIPSLLFLLRFLLLSLDAKERITLFVYEPEVEKP